MTKHELLLVKKALSRIDREEIAYMQRLPMFSWEFSRQYAETLQKLIEHEKKRARSPFYGVKKRTIIGLVAAIIALLLTATACVFHNEIRDFFIHVTEKGPYLKPK